MHGENEVVYLYLDDIIPNRFQPRELFDERALKELAVSIKEHGVIQPIIVRKNGEKYEIIAGERRYKASALAGLTKIPAIVRNLDDKESSKVALLENLQRKNLNPIEEAKTYQKILEIDQMTQEELAKTMGKSQSAVANKLRLLGLSENVQNALLNEKISERHARTLLMIHDKEEQDKLLKKVIQERITVRNLENLIKNDNVAEEEISQQEVSKAIDIPSVPKEEFKEPSFNVPEKQVMADSQPQSNYEPQPEPEQPRFTPPMPDTMIDFTDVTQSLNNQAKKDSEDEIVFENSQDYHPRENSNHNDNFSLNSEPYNTKFINYGEIDRDLEDDDDEDPESKLHYTSTPQTKFNDLSGSTGSGFMTEDDLNKDNLSENSKSSLDSLLHINPPKTTVDRSLDPVPKNKKSTYDELESFEDDFDDDDSNDRQEGLISYDENNNSEEIEKPISVSSTFDENLFKTPSLEDYGRKNKNGGTRANSLNQSSYTGALKNELEPKTEEPKNKSQKLPDMEIQGGVNAIRDLIRSLESRNLEIDTEETNLENSYQILIKIKKTPLE